MKQRAILQDSIALAKAKASTQNDVLALIAKHTVQHANAKGVSEKDILKALQQRETIGSTGFGRGIAIPHCALPSIRGFVTGIITLAEGIDFNALDDNPTKTFLFIVGPEEDRTTHIRILSTFSKILKMPDAPAQLLAADDDKTLRTRFLSYTVDTSDAEKQEKVLFTVYVQNESYFSDILQIFSSVTDGTVSVIETNNARHYLHTMPLFAGFWNEQDTISGKVILAVANKSFMNDTIRRIHMVAEDIESEPGVLITVQDVLYTCGSIEF